MKSFYNFFVAVVSIVLFCFSFLACEITYSDAVGSTRQRAIALVYDTWANGVIPSSTGEQWFKFTATSGTQYLHVSFNTLPALYVQLFDRQNNAVGSRINLNHSTTFTFFTLTIGREYYVRVRPGASGGNTYRIGFNSMLIAPGILSGAVTLTANTWAEGVFTTVINEQWYKFTATSNMQYLHVFFGTLNDLYVQLYDSNGAMLGGRTNLNRSATYTTMLLVSGQIYYVKVTPSSSNTGTYLIAINTSATAPQ